MDPFSLIGALAGAGGSIAAASMGADAETKAADTNWAINLWNNYYRERERKAAIEYAEKLRDEQKLGATDALGNRTYFKEGEGWISELSPEQQALYDYFYNQELPERREQFQRNAMASREESDTANALMDEFRRVLPSDPQEIEALLYSVATRGAGEATRDVTETAMRDATRTGNSNVARIIGELAKQSMEQRGNAAVDAKIQARDFANQEYSSKRGGLANLYNLFAQRAANPLGTSYDPSSIPAGANSLMSLFSQQAQQGNAQGFQAAGMRGGSLSPIEPNFGPANAAGAIGASLNGLGSRVGGMMSEGSMQDQLMKYISAGGQIDMGGGGLFGTMTDRVRQGQGVF